MTDGASVSPASANAAEETVRLPPVDVMLDLESVGNGVTGALVAVAVAPFQRRGGPEPTWESVRESGFQQAISLQSMLDLGLKVSGSGFEFWLKQNDEARAVLLDNPRPFKEVVSGLRKYLMALCDNQPKRLVVWAKPSKYDIAAFEHAVDLLGTQQLWGKSRARDLPTLMDVALDGERPVGLPPELEALTHVPLMDCYKQILIVRQSFRRLNERMGML